MERSSFFNAVLNGEVYDRVYMAEDYARYFGSFIGNGVFPTPSTNLQVVADGTTMDIILKAGKGWLNGYFYDLTDDLTLNVAVADGVLNRIDRVVLRLDFINREIKAYVKKGIFASSPVAPSLVRNADTYELGIADIKVNKGVTKIVQADITDLRQNNNYCGLVAGVVQQIDTTNLFAQFQSTFDLWFEHVKGQLSTDAAGNLQNQIDNMTPTLADYLNFRQNGGTIGTVEIKNGSAAIDAVITPKAGLLLASAGRPGAALESGTFRPVDAQYHLGLANYPWNIIYGNILKLGGTLELKSLSSTVDTINTSKGYLGLNAGDKGVVIDEVANALRPSSTSLGSMSLGTAAFAFKDLFIGSYSPSLSNGYTRLPNGNIMQWGEITCKAKVGTEYTTPITFPIAFPNKPYSIIAVAKYNSRVGGTAGIGSVIVNARSTMANKTGADIITGAINSAGLSTVDNDILVGWISIGH